MSVSRATQARTLHLMVRLVETNSLSSSPFAVLYRLKHLGNCGRAYPVGSEIRYIVHGPRRSERRPLICVSSWKSERRGSIEGRRRRRRMCRGTHKWANLKFKRASGQGCGPTLHWCSVAVNKRRGRSRWAYVGKHSSKTTALFFSEEKVSMSLQGKRD